LAGPNYGKPRGAELIRDTHGKGRFRPYNRKVYVFFPGEFQ
jgi:hypothetical protein